MGRIAYTKILNRQDLLQKELILVANDCAEYFIKSMKVINSIDPIVIIGAGPAGIATAIEAIKRGYKAENITIIEKSGEVAHMISSKYPDEKPVLANYKERISECIGDLCVTDMSKSDFMDYMKKIVRDNNLKIRFHEQVEKITKLKNKQLAVKTNNDVYISDAVFIAIGNMSAPRTLGISVNENVNHRIFYDLQNLKSDMKKVLVVGGGDSAGEYAKILIDRGHQVTLSYRGENFSRMIASNNETTLQLIQENKLRFLPSSQIEKIENDQGLAQIHFKDSKYPIESFDAIVTALGTERPTHYLTSLGISAESEGEDIFTESEMNGLFLVGDLASGKKGGTINFAFNSGVKAFAKACSLYLDCD